MDGVELLFNQTKVREKHFHDTYYDRYIYFEYDCDDELIGFNFMQGDKCDENHQLFLDGYCKVDKKMFSHYKQFRKTFKNVLINDEYKVINEFFWYYVNELKYLGDS